MNEVAITVLMPVYNGGDFLKESIPSILEQTFTDFEFLIINDGSTDNSVEIIESYKDDRIRLVHNPENLKLIASLNKGIELAKGKYIVRMDADDISLPRRLELLYEKMESEPETGMCGSWFSTFGEGIVASESKYSLEHNEICFRHFYQIHLSHGTAIFRKEILEKFNLRFDPDYAHAEDYELWTRVQQYTKLANIPHVLYRVRRHPGEVSVKNRSTQLENSNRIRRRQFEKLGMRISDYEVQLFTDLCHHHYKADPEIVDDTHNVLLRMLKANKESNVCDQKYLSKRIGSMFFALCTNTTKLGLRSYRLYKTSMIREFVPAEKTTKLWFKSVLRK